MSADVIRKSFPCRCDQLAGRGIDADLAAAEAIAQEGKESLSLSPGGDRDR
jgi:hypothetical protein